MYLWQDHGLFGVFHPAARLVPRRKKGVGAGRIQGRRVRRDPRRRGHGRRTSASAGSSCSLTGFYLWYWPGVRRWATAFVIRRGRGRFATNMSLHKVVGLVVFVPLVVITFTGVSVRVPEHEGLVREHHARADAAPSCGCRPNPRSRSPAKGRTPLDADATRAAIRARSRSGSSHGLEPPVRRDGNVERVGRPRLQPVDTRGRRAATSTSCSTSTRARRCTTARPRTATSSTRRGPTGSFPLHTGDFAGNHEPNDLGRDRDRARSRSASRAPRCG